MIFKRDTKKTLISNISKRRLLVFLRKYTLKTRLQLAFLLLLFVSVCLTGGISYAISYKTLEENTVIYSVHNVENIKKSIDAILDTYVQTANNIATDVDIINYVKEYDEMDPGQRYTVYKKVFEKINYNSNKMKNLIAVEILNTRESLVRYPSYGIISEDIEESNIFKEITECADRKMILSLRDLEYDTYQHNNSKAVIISIKVKSLKDGSNIGFVNIAFSEDELYSVISDFFENTGDNVFILDERGSVISHSDKSNIGKVLYSDINSRILEDGMMSSYYERKDSGKKSLVTYAISGESDWKIICEVEHDKLFAKINQIKYVIFGTVIICILVLGILSYIVTKSVTEPLNEVINSIQNSEKDNFTTLIYDDANDEIGFLARRFTDMIQRIKQLMYENYSIKLRQREAEFMVLQAQINPHFLYNTLDMINWMAYLKGNKDICTLVDSLSSFFRLSLSRSNNIVSLGEEIEHARHYTTIQKFRYKDKLNFYYNIDENLLDYGVVRFILQPLIENAIYHGIEPNGGKGNIWVNVKDSNSDIIMEVIDDGKGIQDIEKVFEIFDNSKYERKGFGVNNVNDRIKMVYGDSCGLFFEDNPTGGTIARVIIRKQERVNETDESTTG